MTCGVRGWVVGPYGGMWWSGRDYGGGWECGECKRVQGATGKVQECAQHKGESDGRWGEVT
jgi:hypothetical protein